MTSTTIMITMRMMMFRWLMVIFSRRAAGRE
jgi:hypothetical protein